MADVKWIKITTDIFDDEKMLLIESMPSCDSIIVIWFKLLTLAGKQNNDGVFIMSNRIAYTDEMLAAIFRRDLSTVRLALSTFQQFGMIEVINDAITIPNWNKHQTLDAYEKKKLRDKEYQATRRAKQRQLVIESSDKSSDVAVSEEDIDKELDIDKEEDKERDIITVSKDTVSSSKLQPIIDSWNTLGLKTLRDIKVGTKRYEQTMARIKQYGMQDILDAIDNITKSSFLKGQNKQGWTIVYDWFIKPNNFIKVLEGNYDDKAQSTEQSNQWDVIMNYGKE